MTNSIEIEHDDRTKVYFKLFLDKEIEVSIRDGKLIIECDSNLIIQPMASNYIIVS